MSRLSTGLSRKPNFRIGSLGAGRGGGGGSPLPAINAIRNPSGAGASPGAPGTPPTNWQFVVNGAGLSKQITAQGTEGGITYTAFRVFGTAAIGDSVGIYFDGGNGIAAAPKQQFTETVYLKLAAGTSPFGTKGTLQLSIDELDSTTGYLATDSGADQENTGPTGAPLNTQPFFQTLTTANAGVGFVQPYVFSFFYAAGAVDFTLWVGTPNLVSNTGYVATRTYKPWLFTTANKQTMSRSAHFARDDIAALNIVLPNWYVDTTNNGGTYAELGTGANISCTASVEYPAGVFTQIKFGGVATGVAATLKNLTSDTTTIAIPKGSQFWIRVFYTSTAGVLYSTQGAAALGDVATFAASGLVDQTMSGTISGTAGFSYPPVAIVGITAKQGAELFGTSRTAGVQDTNDSSGDLGVSARSLGPVVGYCNGGVPGDSMLKFVLSHANRVALGRAYATDIFVEHGINDGASNEATKETNIAAIWGYFPTKRVHALTVDPNTSGAWILPDGSDQTVLQDETTFNTFIKTKPAPLFAVCDIAPVVSLSSTPTKWAAPGYTADGLHETQLANLAIKASGRVRLNA